MEDIAESVINSTKTFLLDCDPLDEDGDGSVKDDIQITGLNLGYFVSGNSITFNIQDPLPSGTYTIDYRCVRN